MKAKVAYLFLVFFEVYLTESILASAEKAHENNQDIDKTSGAGFHKDGSDEVQAGFEKEKNGENVQDKASGFGSHDDGTDKVQAAYEQNKDTSDDQGKAKDAKSKKVKKGKESKNAKQVYGNIQYVRYSKTTTKPPKTTTKARNPVLDGTADEGGYQKGKLEEDKVIGYFDPKEGVIVGYAENVPKDGKGFHPDLPDKYDENGNPIYFGDLTTKKVLSTTSKPSNLAEAHECLYYKGQLGTCKECDDMFECPRRCFDIYGCENDLNEEQKKEKREPRDLTGK